MDKTLQWLLRHSARTYFSVVFRIHSILSGALLFFILCRTRNFFDAEYYRTSHKPLRFEFAPMLDFSFIGARYRRDPNQWFSQNAYASANPDIGRSMIPPVLHYFLYGRYEGRPLKDGAVVRSGAQDQVPLGVPAVKPYSRFEHLWPDVEKDLMGIRDVERDLSPTAGLKYRLGERMAFAGGPVSGRAARQLAERLPSRIDHLLIVPWLGIAGGSERIGQRLVAMLRDHYRDGGFCVFAPDSSFDVAMEDRKAYGVPIIALNDIADFTSSPGDIVARMEIMDRILTQYRPRTVHCLNSWVGWMTIKERGRYFSRDSNIFGNIYSDVRIDGHPVGSFWAFLPDTIDHLAGVFSDNATVVRKAREYFGFGRSEMDRHYVIRTAVLGLGGGDPAADLRRFQAVKERQSLWMSRIAKEKKIDALEAIARTAPHRRFVMHGAIIPGALPVDLSGLRSLPNVDVRGEFAGLKDLPLNEVDSYVFTTSAEGMPIAVLEAAQMGMPIVAPNVGGIGEFIDETTGWLVSGPDAIDEYVAALDEIGRRPDLAANRVMAAQRRLLEHYSWDSFKRSIAAVPGFLQ